MNIEDARQGSCATMVVPMPDADTAYEAHIEAAAKTGTAPTERAAWERSWTDAFHLSVVGVMEAVAAEAGLSALPRAGLSGQRADLDRRFTSIAWGGTVEVAWRRDGGDAVVAVMAGGPWKAELADEDAYDGDLVWTGMAPASFMDAHDRCVSAIRRLVVVALAQAGHGADPREATREDLATAARARLAAVARGMDETLAGLDEGARRDYVEALREAEINDDELPVTVLVPAYDVDSGTVVLFVPEPDGDLVTYFDVPGELAEAVGPLEADEHGMAPLPLTPATLAWMRARSGEASRTFLVTAGEYAAALGEPCVVAWDEEGETVEAELAPAPGPWPTP